MAYQMTFQRYELKYLLTPAQKREVLETIRPYMELDQYGRTTIRNIYYDTGSFRLIRRSLEQPPYKEKLRVRSYRQAKPGDPVFVELKKKHQSVVYKRRLTLPERVVSDCFAAGAPLPVSSQIGEEIQYFRDYYAPLFPAVFLTYEREAFRMKDQGEELRVTFDENILYRQQEISLESGVYGTPLLPPGATLMEIKTSGGIPLWLVHSLTAARIFKTSFSKYGAAYGDIQRKNFKGGLCYA